MKAYLGDGVYVDHDGYAVVLTTENGYESTNRIVLEPEVIAKLEEWTKVFREALVSRVKR